MSTPGSAYVTRLDGPAPEAQIARHLAGLARWLGPVLIIVSWFIWGIDGALSSAYAVALVVVNFLVAAWLMSTTARISLALMAGAAAFGYLFRLGLITIAVLAVRNMSWVNLVPLGLTIIVTHLGLLVWELRYVSMSLAYPGLKPAKNRKLSKDV